MNLVPIYEFYCSDCHRIFNFLSTRVNTDKRPDCPRCGRAGLDRKVSMFAAPKKGGASESEGGEAMSGIDESKLERAMASLASEAERIDENDPRQAVNLMRKLTDMTGISLGPGMEEALRRMEAGEDPEAVEAELGGMMDGEEPVIGMKTVPKSVSNRPPARDEELYRL